VRFVLDSSALLNNFQPKTGDEMVIPSSVAEELKSHEGREKIEMLISLGAVIEKPLQRYSERAKEIAEDVGELGRLSDVDIEVIALALEKKACVVSDDYSIENVCRYAGIDFISVATDGIKKLFKYAYRCTGCGRYYKKYYEECPVCGSKFKARRL
jgi:UPF0271 protein